MHAYCTLTLLFWSVCGAAAPIGSLRTLEDQLCSEDPAALVVAARSQGDAARGAIVFHQPHVACTKCHSVDDSPNPLGPDLTRLPPETTDQHLVESVLFPSRVIRQGYESLNVITADGRNLSGILAEDTSKELVLRDVQNPGKTLRIDKQDIEEYAKQSLSAMPIGQVAQLTSRQEFLDLIRYLIALREGGPAQAKALQPPPSAYALRIPEYEQHVDHAGLIRDLDSDAFDRGEAIYKRVCVNCHGTKDQPGSLPTSLRFASGQFKSGSDPYTMYQTLTRGFGMMVPQTWMVPRQKYDAVHYIRETYLKPNNPTQYFSVTPAYLATLPTGDTRGPEPEVIEPWVTMDYGPSLINTYEVGSDETNYAYKGIAMRLDAGPGGVSRGSAWTIFDHDTLRIAADWVGEGFIDWNGIHFNGQHQVHPQIVGDVELANPTGPGWANPETGSFDDPRIRGRDGRPYGPLPRNWAHYQGLYHRDVASVVRYTVGEAQVLETSGVVKGDAPLFSRTLNIGPRSRPMLLQVAHFLDMQASFNVSNAAGEVPAHVALVVPQSDSAAIGAVAFDGKTRLDVSKSEDFDLSHGDFTITARIRTRAGGVIFAKTHPGKRWVPDAKAFFIRDGKLCFDIGWVGCVQSERSIHDGQWHNVAAAWKKADSTLSLYIDGQLDGSGRLGTKGDDVRHVVRIGAGAPDFPQPDSFLKGELAEVRFFASRIAPELLAEATTGEGGAAPKARWKFAGELKGKVADVTGSGHDAAVCRETPSHFNRGLLAAALVPPVPGAEWRYEDGNLRLALPAGPEPIRFTVYTSRPRSGEDFQATIASVRPDDARRDLEPMTHGGARHWTETLTATVQMGKDDQPFAVDVLTHPESNPWLAQVRLTGLDFFADGNRAAVCTWDGDVWLVTGLSGLPAHGATGGDTPASPTLTWQRMASGLFQPLGLRIVREQVYVTCRDQIVILHDLNGDGETDYFENFNNDHQVTDHFHEFAMGLQTDAAGNFYYAKGARHALPALVPHHGTLLRVSPDGSRTDILAKGFRAPNGVCVNPDGTFYLTDQEGHWTPKNRINLVTEGGYYGNWWGYHDITDPSDAAMQQPVVWITNAVDRSPAELIWVDSPAWGPLRGALLNTSYGYGKLYVVPHETVAGRVQGGVCEFPLPPLPTGIMRGRFHPRDGQLYTCGMFAWAGNQTQPGGIYRIRCTGKPMHLPVGLHASPGHMAVTFTEPLDPSSAAPVSKFSVKVWTLKRSENYGSDHINEHPLEITAARIAEDPRTLILDIPSLEPTWCMEIKYTLKAADGTEFQGMIHNTVHAL